ncbi:hypothetical protein [Staphylothermus marinus]|nr:hypothetical protein [Staphylothermus marinus]
MKNNISRTSRRRMKTMTTARRMFVINKLLRKKNVVGKVAARYVAAGFNVTVNPPLKGVYFTASKHGVRYAGIVLWQKKKVGEEIIGKAKEIADKYKVKPIIILYGSGPIIDKDIVAKAREAGIIIKRIR